MLVMMIDRVIMRRIGGLVMMLGWGWSNDWKIIGLGVCGARFEHYTN
jgi:hypothetical protein